MNTLNEMFRKIGKAVLAQVTLACALPLAIPAANLLQNPGFEEPAPGVPPGKTVSYTMTSCQTGTGGPSAAAGWGIWVNTCGTEVSTTLVPSTAPNGGNYMLHVVTDGLSNGIYENFSSTPQTVSSIWVFVNSGCIGMGTGFYQNTADTDEMTCLTGHWIHFYSVPNGHSPATEFLVYAVADGGNPASATKGADFYVDNGQVLGVANDASANPNADAATEAPGN